MPQAPRRSPGRPRDPRVGAAVATATRELLMEIGYQAMSLELVATRAGVARASIYRRWRNKAQLVYETVFTAVGPESVPDTGSVVDDLTALAHALVDEFAAPAAVAATPGILADFGADETFRAMVRGRFLTPTAEALRAVLRRAVDRGELPATVPADAILDALGGAVFFRSVIVGRPPDRAAAAELVRVLLDGARHSNRRKSQA